jgi:hypothetical protein
VSSIFLRAAKRLQFNHVVVVDVGRNCLTTRIHPHPHPQFVDYFPNRVFNRYIGMMVDTAGSMSTRAGPSVDMVSQKDDDTARSGFVTGGWKRLLSSFSPFPFSILILNTQNASFRCD